jgi:hypothetical protein
MLTILVAWIIIVPPTIYDFYVARNARSDDDDE